MPADNSKKLLCKKLQCPYINKFFPYPTHMKSKISMVPFPFKGIFNEIDFKANTNVDILLFSCNS